MKQSRSVILWIWQIVDKHLRCEARKVFSLLDLPEYDTRGTNRRLLLCRHLIVLIRAEYLPKADLKIENAYENFELNQIFYGIFFDNL